MRVSLRIQKAPWAFPQPRVWTFWFRPGSAKEMEIRKYVYKSLIGKRGGGWTTHREEVGPRACKWLQGLTVAHISMKLWNPPASASECRDYIWVYVVVPGSYKTPVGKPLSRCLALYSVHKALPLLKSRGRRSWRQKSWAWLG